MLSLSQGGSCEDCLKEARQKTCFSPGGKNFVDFFIHFYDVQGEINCNCNLDDELSKVHPYDNFPHKLNIKHLAQARDPTSTDRRSEGDRKNNYTGKLRSFLRKKGLALSAH